MLDTTITRHTGLTAVGGLLLGMWLCCGCDSFYVHPNKSSPVNVRLENRTSSFVEVTITVSSEEATESSSDAGSAATDDQAAASSGGEDATGRDTPSPQPEDTGSNGGGSEENSPGGDAGSNGSSEPPAPQVVTIGLRDPVPPSDRLSLTAKSSLRLSQTTVSEGTIRLAPETFSDGVVLCGDQITVSAHISSSETASVLFSGAGTGTVGFDSGSVGLEGERLLLNSVHFECGETVVIRVTADGTSAGPGGLGTGEVEVLGRGQTPPDPVFDSGSSVDTQTDYLEFRVNNSTASFAQLHLVLGPPSGPVTAVASESEEEDAESDGGFDVRVPPGFLSTGVVACESQVILVGSIVVPGVGVDEADTFTQAVLTGVGTGTVNFDPNSVGTSVQQRLLLEGVHYTCGDIIQVEFIDDGDPTGEEPLVGQATVSLVQ